MESAAGPKKDKGAGVRGGSEISDLATVSSWGVISHPTSSHVLDDHLGIYKKKKKTLNRSRIVVLQAATATKVKKSVSVIWGWVGGGTAAAHLPFSFYAVEITATTTLTSSKYFCFLL